MLQHAALEITREQLARSVELWELLGFELVEAPPALRADYVWVQRDGTQIHLALVEEPGVPALGHVAVVTPDFELTEERLRAAGFEVERRRSHWDSPRSIVHGPGGHRIELMQSPPPPG